MLLKNGIIRDTAMAELRQENGKVRHSAAYPTGAERFTDGRGFSENLFWDADPADLDLKRNKKYVVQRALERGTISDILQMLHLYGIGDVIATAKSLRSLEPKALSFIACLADEPRENFRCYTNKQSLKAPWIY